MRSYTTLGDILGGTHAVTFLEGEGKTKRVSYDALRARALSLLTELRERGVRPGDHLVLFLDDNEQLLVAFWAAILGGLVPVPIAIGLSDEHRARLVRVLTLLERPHLYTDARNAARVASPVTPILIEKLRGNAPPAEELASEPDDVAFIQFSSGSTSDPKGVVLTHRNLLTNIDAIIDWTKFTPEDVSLSWMPLTHDMGLIGFHLTMMAAGMNQYLMPTSLFVRHPLYWIQAASEFGATILASPNFGYRHFLKALHKSEIEMVHLEAVRMIVNGAEPIVAAVCEEFLDALAPHGLRRSAMFPVYGLAEASLAVTFTPLGSGVRTLSGRVRLGFPIKHCEVTIGDDSHVLIRGGNVSRRYYGQPERAADEWLDTGDLGFLADGELVITGRAKEVIFVHGQNVFPHDLELVAETFAGAEPGKVVAAGDDEVLLFVLHRGALDDFVPIMARLRGALSEHAGVDVARVVPVKRIPKTTSGKVQRHLLMRQLAEGEFDDVLAELAKLTRADAAAPQSDIEATLLELFRSADPDLKIGPDDNLFEAGLSSLTLVEIFSRIEELWPDALDVTEMFDYPTIRELAQRLAPAPVNDVARVLP